MMNSFSIKVYGEEEMEGEKLYIVMLIYSSWHMGPDYLLVGVYKNKDTAIRAAKERAKEEDEYYKHSIENGLLDCDDYEETTIHFNEMKISKEL